MTQRERYLATIDAFRRSERLPGQATRKLPYLGFALAVAGQRLVYPTNRAALDLALGDRERALQRIERAAREQDLDPVLLQLDERLDPLRSEPRFRKVVERMGLPQDDRRGGR